MASGMGMSKELKQLAVLFLALFVIGIIVGVTYIGFSYLKESMCTQADSNHVWQDDKCLESSTNSTEVTVPAIDKVATVETAVDIVLGLLSLVVLILVFAIIIKVALGFAKSTR